MTVYEAYGKIWEYFKTHDSFVMQEDFSKIILISDCPSRDKATIQAALNDWVKSEVIVKQEQPVWDRKEKTSELQQIYILKKSLHSEEQQVSVHVNLAGAIMKEVNDFCEIIEDKTDWCDPSNIKNKDVLNLIHILAYYRAKYKESLGDNKPDVDK